MIIKQMKKRSWRTENQSKRTTANRLKIDTDPSPQNLWFRLMKLTNLVNRPFFSHFAKSSSLNINDWRVLMTLAFLDREVAAHEIAETVGLHPMNVSRSVTKLRRQGRVKERLDPANQRRKLLILTGEGQTLYKSLHAPLKQRTEFLFALMTLRETEILSKLVDGLIDRLEHADTMELEREEKHLSARE